MDDEWRDGSQQLPAPALDRPSRLELELGVDSRYGEPPTECRNSFAKLTRLLKQVLLFAERYKLVIYPSTRSLPLSRSPS